MDCRTDLEFVLPAFELQANPRTNTVVKTPFEWHTEALGLFGDLKSHRGARFGLTIAPCGSGKSFYQVLLAILDIKDNGKARKQCIAVPQSHIGKSFIGDGKKDSIEINFEGEELIWKVLPKHNFCTSSNPDIINRLIRWLTTPGEKLAKNYPNYYSGNIAIVSHQALVLAWNRMTADQRADSVKYLTLRLDEAHHANGIYEEEEIEKLSKKQRKQIQDNQVTLGEICRVIYNEPTAKIHFTTATLFRGDRQTILFPAVRKQFVQYRLDWLRFYRTLGIETFSIEHEEYDKDPIDHIIARIKAEPNEKFLIVIPSIGDKWRTLKMLQILISKLIEAFPDKKSRILDLVTPETQDKNKRKLLAEPKFVGNIQSLIDIVITCRLGREGTDWVPCSRILNTSCERSATLAVQTIGRAFRRWGNKNSVKVCYFVPSFISGNKKDVVADRTHVLLHLTLIEEMFYPIFPKLITNNCSQGVSTDPVEIRDVLGNAIDVILIDLFRGLEEQGNSRSAASIKALINDLLNLHGFVEPENRKLAEEVLMVKAKRRLSGLSQIPSIDIAFVRERGYNKTFEKESLIYKSLFLSKYNAEDLQEFIAVVEREWWTTYKAYKIWVETGILGEYKKTFLKSWGSSQKTKHRENGLKHAYVVALNQIRGFDFGRLHKRQPPVERSREENKARAYILASKSKKGYLFIEKLKLDREVSLLKAIDQFPEDYVGLLRPVKLSG